MFHVTVSFACPPSDRNTMLSINVEYVKDNST
jgi:hypothetical protein